MSDKTGLTPAGRSTQDMIFHNVLESMQDSEEIFCDMSVEEYVSLMRRIAAECEKRIAAALSSAAEPSPESVKSAVPSFAAIAETGIAFEKFRPPVDEEIASLVRYLDGIGYGEGVGDLVARCYVAVADDYATDCPGYAGKVMVVLYPGGDNLSEAYGIDKNGILRRI